MHINGVARILSRMYRWWRRPFSSDTWRRTLYALSSLPLGLVWFVATVVGLSVSTPLALIAIGVPLLAVTFAFTRFAARVERERARRLLGSQAFDPVRRTQRVVRVLPTFRARVADPQTWRDIAYLLSCLPLGALTFATAVGIWVVAAHNLVYPIVNWHTDLSKSWGGPTHTGAVALHFAAGVVALVIAPLLIAATTGLQSRLVISLLGPVNGRRRESGPPHA